MPPGVSLVEDLGGNVRVVFRARGGDYLGAENAPGYYLDMGGLLKRVMKAEKRTEVGDVKALMAVQSLLDEMEEVPPLLRKNASRRKNPEYHSPQAAAPSAKRLSEGLGISMKEAENLRYMLKTGNLTARGVLHMAREYMNADDVEYIHSREDTAYTRKGLSVVNTGDAYATTLVYDHKTHKFGIAAWGDIVERQPRRFGD
jgi:hypothetical protein